MQDTKLEDIPLPEDPMNHIHSELPKVNSIPHVLQGAGGPYTQSQNRSMYEMSNMCNEIHSIKGVYPPLPPLPPPPKPPPPPLPLPKVENEMEYQRYTIQGKYRRILYRRTLMSNLSLSSA